MKMVLATDMKQHFALVANFRTLMTHTRATASSGMAPAFSHVATTNVRLDRNGSAPSLSRSMMLTRRETQTQFADVLVDSA